MLYFSEIINAIYKLKLRIDIKLHVLCFGCLVYLLFIDSNLRSYRMNIAFHFDRNWAIAISENI